MLNISHKLFVILLTGFFFVGEATSKIKGTGSKYDNDLLKGSSFQIIMIHKI